MNAFESEDDVDEFWEEMSVPSSCALRFDGYKYAEEHELEEPENEWSNYPAFERFANEPDFSLDRNFLHAMFFLFQRFRLREHWLRSDSFGMKIV